MAQNYTDIHHLLEENQSLYRWKAPLRPYKKQSKRLLQFFLAVTFLLSIIVYFAGDPVMLMPMWAALFLLYALTITPPPMVENKITRFGIENGSIYLKWDTLDHFYFESRWGYEILCIVTRPPYNYHTYMVILDEAGKRKIASILGEHIEFRSHPKKSLSDRIIDLLSYLVPDEEDATVTSSAEEKAHPKLHHA